MSALAAGLPQLTATVGTSIEHLGDGVTVSHPSRDDLTHAEAAALTAEIRSTLRGLAEMVEAVGQLVTAAWAMRADKVLGYESWEAYCGDLFADVRSTRLPVETRRAVVVALRGAGMSTRASASALGVSVGTVHSDCSELNSPDRPSTVTSLDGRQRPARVPSPRTTEPTPRRFTTDRIVELIEAAGEDGMTVREVGRRLRLHHGQASGALSRLEARGRVRRSGEARERCAVYRILPSRKATCGD